MTEITACRLHQRGTEKKPKNTSLRKVFNAVGFQTGH